MMQFFYSRYPSLQTPPPPPRPDIHISKVRFKTYLLDALANANVEERKTMDAFLRAKLKGMFTTMSDDEIDQTIRFMPWAGLRGLYEEFWDSKEEFVSNCIRHSNGDTFHTKEGSSRLWWMSLQLMKPHVDLDKAYTGNPGGINATLDQTEMRSFLPFFNVGWKPLWGKDEQEIADLKSKVQSALAVMRTYV